MWEDGVTQWYLRLFVLSFSYMCFSYIHVDFIYVLHAYGLYVIVLYTWWWCLGSGLFVRYMIPQSGIRSWFNSHSDRWCVDHVFMLVSYAFSMLEVYMCFFHLRCVGCGASGVSMEGLMVLLSTCCHECMTSYVFLMLVYCSCMLAYMFLQIVYAFLVYARSYIGDDCVLSVYVFWCDVICWTCIGHSWLVIHVKWLHMVKFTLVWSKVVVYKVIVGKYVMMIILVFYDANVLVKIEHEI